MSQTFDLEKFLVDVFDPVSGENVAVVVDRPIPGVPDHAAWRERRAMNERELARLEAVWRGPLARIPLLAEPPGPALVTRVGEGLAPALTPRGEA